MRLYDDLQRLQIYRPKRSFFSTPNEYFFLINAQSVCSFLKMMSKINSRVARISRLGRDVFREGFIDD